MRVFISYSHDSTEHSQRVLELATRLRQDGIDANLDQYEPAPAQGWPRWMEQQIAQADHVLVLCTPTLRRRFEGNEEPGVGKGGTWEGLLVQQVLYDAQTYNRKFVPVMFDQEDEAAALPSVLRPYTHYRYPSGYEALYRHLTAQPAVIKPPLGAVKAMPPNPTSASTAASASTSTATAVAPRAQRSQGMPDTPPAKPPGAVGRLDRGQRDRLIELLLGCQAMMDRSTRDRIVDRLDDITPHIHRHDMPQMDIDGIVSACSTRAAGIERLIEALRFFEGKTWAMDTVDEFIARVQNG